MKINCLTFLKLKVVENLVEEEVLNYLWGGMHPFPFNLAMSIFANFNYYCATLQVLIL